MSVPAHTPRTITRVEAHPAPEAAPRIPAARPDRASRGRAMVAHPAGSARARTGPTAVHRPQWAARLLAFPTEDDVRRLARAAHPLSLSVLLPTSPAGVMSPADRSRLEALVRDSERRLRDEPDRRGAAAVRAGLDAAVARAVERPTDHGLAILVSPRGAHLHHLRVRPRERVVLDPTFATRDLIRSTSEDPPFLMLVIDGRAARLFHYDQRYALPILGHDFPMARPELARRDRAAVGTVDRARREQLRAFLRRVDARLVQRVAEHGLPVVLVASERTAAEFQAVARTRRIAAVVRTGGTRLPLPQLEARARAALAGHVTDRAAAALDAVHVGLRRGGAVAGLADAWAAMLSCEPSVVVVERSYAAAVRVHGDGFRLAEDPEAPGVIDDAVDELLEAVLVRGGDVVAVPDGALAHHGRLVLAVRGRRHALAG